MKTFQGSATETPATDCRTTEFKTYANYLRARIADLGRLVQCFKKHPGVTQPDLRFCKVESDRGEMAANIVLSFRHLEDASMRLGKAIQAYDGGVSCYNADMGHGQEIPKGPDAIIGDKCIDLKCGEFFIRDASGNQITESTFKQIQALTYNLGFTLGVNTAGDRVSYHFYSPCCRVASFGDIKSVFVFLTEKLTKKLAESGEVVHADAISWPAGESARPPFVQPPRAFVAKPFTDESHSA